MPRRERRLGIAHINNRKERDITFHKRRVGLFKGVADLSALTGARVGIILQAENENLHSFGTPSAKPIVDAVLSGRTPSVDKEKATKIAQLQSELARVDMDNMTKEKKSQISFQHMKKIQDENPGMTTNLVFSKEEDLGLEDLYKLFNDLSRVKKDNQIQVLF
uniref:Uncharacterized protein n=1 Tax=Avena sativa TaxID=4498 RepID=A0ACD5W9Z9_AVESA